MNKNYWVYEGSPDNVSLIVPNTNPENGGYLLIVLLANGNYRFFATRFPGRSVVSWKNNIDKFGGCEIQKVLVSHPMISYENVKRKLHQYTVESKEDLHIDICKQKAEELMDLDKQLSKERRSFTKKFSHIYRNV
mgnify:CR=1 FL=1